jgi:hypothetical protein
MAERASVTQLYRQLLRLHRQQLPPLFRDLGDRVVREEWRQMVSAERRGKATQQHWEQFTSQWRSYAATLSKSQAEPRGGVRARPRRVRAHCAAGTLLSTRGVRLAFCARAQAFAPAEELLGEEQLAQQLTQEQQLQLARLREEAARLRSTVPERDG